jgi:hypothetical protein
MTINETTGVISWSPTSTGEFDVSVLAQNVGGSDTQVFTITVVALPEITSTAVTQAVVDDSYVYEVSATGYPTPTFTLTDSPAGMAIDAATGVITWSPTSTGEFDVSVTAQNAIGSTTQDFTITVASLPEITSTAVTQAIVNESYVYDLSATGYPAPTFTLTDSPAGMNIDAATGVITWTPTNTGEFDVSVTAQNVAGSSVQAFTITVASLPEITSTAVTQAIVGESYVYDLSATGYPTPTFTLTDPPAGMEIDAATGVITWTPTSPGEFDISVAAQNVAGSSMQAFTITVASLPEITSTAVTNVVLGSTYIYNVHATGYPTPTYTLITAPSGMTINESTGEISWVPNALGIYDVTVQAENFAGTTEQNFQVTVVTQIFLPIIVR